MWCNEGDQVIILVDMHEDVRVDPILTAATQMGVLYAITTQHDQ